MNFLNKRVHVPVFRVMNFHIQIVNNAICVATVLSSIHLNGSLVYITYQGGTTAQRFCEYMEEQLTPSLEKDYVVIMVFIL